MSKSDCFRAAMDYMKEHQDHWLVHGRITSGGKRFCHAWVEDDDWVYEVSKAWPYALTKFDFYDVVQVAPHDPSQYRKYDYRDTLFYLFKLKHFGPWHIYEPTELV